MKKDKLLQRVHFLRMIDQCQCGFCASHDFSEGYFKIIGEVKAIRSLFTMNFSLFRNFSVLLKNIMYQIKTSKI